MEVVHYIKNNMKTIILLVLTISLSMCMCCCRKIFPDEKLTLQRKNYLGNELRIDGYYTYYFSEGKSYGTFFYKNGIVLNITGKDGDYSEKRFLDEELIDHVKGTKSLWSIFDINDDNIIIQGWGSSEGGGLPVITRYGKILDDTTFIITESEVNGRIREISEIYSFHEFSPKPDSTNVYIK